MKPLVGFGGASCEPIENIVGWIFGLSCGHRRGEGGTVDRAGFKELRPKGNATQNNWNNQDSPNKKMRLITSHNVQSNVARSSALSYVPKR